MTSLLQRGNRRFSLLLRRFLRAENGSMYVVGAMIAMPLVGLVGVGADTARVYLVKSRLAASVDAAALAGGKIDNRHRVASTVQRYFRINFPDGYLGANITQLIHNQDAAAETLTVSAKANVTTSFMHLFGHPTVEVAARARVSQKVQNLNLVLSLDVSGSMGGRSGGARKIDAARRAAQDLVSILHGASRTPGKIRIGVVPWNGKVNVSLNGAAYDPRQTRKVFVSPFVHPRTGKVQGHVWRVNSTPVPLLDKPHDRWSGCVLARYSHDGQAVNDADLVSGLRRLPSAGWSGWEPVTAQDEARSRGGQCSNCTPCPSHGLTPMTDNKRTVERALDELRSPGGHTNIAQGLVWGWRLLDDKAPFTEAADRAGPRTIQAVVLLSDGAHCGARGDAYRNAFGGCSATARRKMDARLLRIARNMKAQGVVVYAIQFGTNNADLRRLLRDVASSGAAPHYHYAPDAESLRRVFRQIAGSLSELRITQ